ncbi:DUF935 family protein [Gilliamella sp. B14384H2]|uniref:DUF935 domain-containing protein n=1 Tax=unclassified Gilliamella TaxID=2685620 RepID=UPI0018DD1ACC|nr:MULTISPECIES: DUF935 family protein [unclassified Gilliamella]MBI0036723.1 DUF935 family protein [Gilliamella sp. B14384G10]MBI0040665.1 DUF935 family protein [Gilliamella sp. B14384G7]MBI0050718.1 DUF935 family protein [Gilliamella sp. B14384G13]MBI0053010.1 DUF935 family protein [Gilliamella sp. B14384H2]
MLWFKGKKPHVETGRELAGTGEGNDITRPYLGPLALPDDSVLRKRGGGRLDIYKEVLNDDEVKSAFTQRQDAVISREWKVEPGGDKPIDIEAADAMSELLKSVGFDRVTKLMHFGVFYGYAVAELIYGIKDNLYWIDDIKVRDRRRFRFSPAGELRLLTQNNMHEGIECQAPYFWHYATGADHDDEPYGLGLAHWLYWPSFFKRNDIKFWLIFLEKFGMPTAVGKYGTGATTEQKRDLLALTRAIQTDSGIIIPETMNLDLLQIARSGAGDYKAFYDSMNEAIRRVTVGQITSSGGASNSIGGDESLQAAVLASIAKSDSDVMCESWNRGPGTWFTQMNFPGAAVPQISRIFDEPEDLKSLSERDKNIIESTGYRPTLAVIQDKYGGEWEEKPQTQVVGTTQIEKNVEFAEQQQNNFAPVLQSNRLNSEIQPVTDKWINQIKELVDNIQSLEELRDKLFELIPDMQLDEYAKVMADALTAANLAGRTELLEDSKNG